MKVENGKFLTSLSSEVIICGFVLNLIFGQSIIMTASWVISAGLNVILITSRPGRIAFFQFLSSRAAESHG